MLDALLREVKEVLAEIFAPFFWELKGMPVWLATWLMFLTVFFVVLLAAVIKWSWS